MSGEVYTFAGDEAGDVSFRFDRGASRYFVMALVGTTAPTQLRQTLDRVRSQRHLPVDFEFKFHRLGNQRLRQAVWSALQEADFEVWGVAVDKQRLPDVLRTMPPRTFYAYFLNEAVQLVPDGIKENAPLWLDEFDRAGKTVAEFKRIASQRNLRYRFGRIRAIRSRSEGLVQVADIVAGAMLRHYDRGDNEGFQHLTGKIIKVLEYPIKQNPLG